ncbi:Uncharacterised protein [Enterobacter cloacae]|nr:Uncharacterised protein [Enterobacter cloacae]
MVTAVAAFSVRIDLRMADLHQATAASMQQTPVGDHTCANVMINHHLNYVACAPGGTKQCLRHRPGADIMLNVDRHTGVVFQHVAQRHLFDVFIKRHAVNNAIFGINNSRQGDRNRR